MLSLFSVRINQKVFFSFKEDIALDSKQNVQNIITCLKSRKPESKILHMQLVSNENFCFP